MRELKLPHNLKDVITGRTVKTSRKLIGRDRTRRWKD